MCTKIFFSQQQTLYLSLINGNLINEQLLRSKNNRKNIKDFRKMQKNKRAKKDKLVSKYIIQDFFNFLR